MFSDTLTSWDLGLEPNNSFFTEEKQEAPSSAVIFDDALVQDLLGVEQQQQQQQQQQLQAPLELDLFAQELKRQEQEQLEAAKDSNIVMAFSAPSTSAANDSFMDEAFDNSLAVIEDPKMINSPEPALEDSGIDLNLTQEGTQNLIEEMESFLRQHEQQQEDTVAEEVKEVKEREVVTFVEQPQPDSGLDILKAVMEEVEMEVVEEEVKETPAISSSELTAEDSYQAEAILDALIKGDLNSVADHSNTAVADIEEIVEETPTTITRREPANASSVLDNINVSNVSEFYDADGKQILVVVTKDTPSNEIQQINLAPVMPVVAQVVASEPEEDSSDSDWTPFAASASKPRKAAPKATPPKAKGVSVGRVAKQRGPYSKRAHASVKDKKERKKLQNVEAARRYRDKKKAEQNVVENEEDLLAGKNRKLKAQLGEMENELKTLKKLMTELGLVK